MKPKKEKLVSVAIKAIVAVVLVLILCFFGNQSLSLATELALLSAKSYLPEGRITVTSPVTTSFNEALTTTAFLQQEKLTTENSAQKAVKALSAVDDDIQALIEKAKKQGADDKKDGDIYEYTFTDDGVTDTFGVVRVKNVNETQISIEDKLNEKLEIETYEGKPSVLIYHTHTTETYQLLDRDFYAQGFLTRSSDPSVNMVRVGKAVKSELEKMGIGVIHDTAIYDNPYSGAYYRSMDAAEAYLEKYPSIRITLDLHRDAIEDESGVKTKPTATIDGKKAAQIMIISGCQEEGNGITDLPEWEKNLTFALKLQKSMEENFPGLTRPLYFCPRSYNMSLTPMSLLIEMGTDANTVDEAVYSGKMLGQALGKLILKEANN